MAQFPSYSTTQPNRFMLQSWISICITRTPFTESVLAPSHMNTFVSKHNVQSCQPKVNRNHSTMYTSLKPNWRTNS